MQYLVFLFGLMSLPFVALTANKKPHIVFIVADDLGWDDVSFHGSGQIPTPNIDGLAKTGVILNNYYVSPICTPTRSAIMTGKYPIHTGMQHSVILAAQPYGLGLNETLMPQYLKRLGYATHGVGKWHLGFFKYEYTPIQRGFDSYFGYWCGKGDYWDHSNNEKYGWGLDLHDSEQDVWTEWGHYSTDLFAEKAVNVISTHNASVPLFLYLPFQAVHSANFIQPLQAPPDLIDKFKNIKDERRRIFAAMVSSMDGAIKKVVDSLKARSMYNNSIIVFTTDNGGPANGFDSNMASNFPLRGVKRTLWEGGIRGTAFIHSPLITKPGRVMTELMHVSDWLPTLYTVAGGDIHDLQNLDGFDLWDSISTDAMSPRVEMVHNIDPVNWEAAYRFREWKIVVNQTKYMSGWYPPPNIEEREPHPATLRDAVVKCGPPPEIPVNCTASDGPCLFNIKNDPCEYVNLAKKELEILNNMLIWLEGYKKGMVPIRNTPLDPSANPANYGGAWTAWKDQKMHT
ncbi:arylsulfatase J isoform X2 [Nematostella vectensis]|uniref:arylsulfatase J isoform X2 n=1 Tax=Nematostella vectensis TaxID=45351 RepID=UPI0020773DA1|nr:arylsulfatase J isoform X2 [Nematostella vectensis]